MLPVKKYFVNCFWGESNIDMRKQRINKMSPEPIA